METDLKKNVSINDLDEKEFADLFTLETFSLWLERCCEDDATKKDVEHYKKLYAEHFNVKENSGLAMMYTAFCAGINVALAGFLNKGETENVH